MRFGPLLPTAVYIPLVPSAPDQLTVDSVDTTSAAVSWNQSPGLDQTQHHYQISYHCPGTEPHITTTSSHVITLSDLEPATQYSVIVCTVLENGKQSQLVSTTFTTKHVQWWKRPYRVAAVFVLLAVIIGLWDSYATSERDQLQNRLNTRTTERDQLQTSYNTRLRERPAKDQLQHPDYRERPATESSKYKDHRERPATESSKYQDHRKSPATDQLQHPD
ncbi:unnamed protein product [Oncorhynchus mykiss]|uniref:Fibronectin type-III domain-containing protein n=1 Tax=Oncorhynchus mykiss TaxID=8022 RepID=A0A060YDL9_ONCMY|nr:unnamed protein product [Oncorhynchus mykiss]